MIRPLIALILMTCAPCLAQSAPASEESIRDLLRVTEARKLVDGTTYKLDETTGRPKHEE